jgi:hypothetical protein
MGQDIKRQKTFLINEFKEYSYCDKKMFHATGGEYEIPFPTEKTEGPHNLESCHKCKEHHKLLIEEITIKFEKFPNCCDFHQNLNNLNLFKKEDFKNIPQVTANKIMFSYHHIINNLENEDWYVDIANYLEYTVESYGSFPPNYGEPFYLGNFYNCLLHLLNNIENKITSDKISNIEVKTRINKIRYLLTTVEVEINEENSTDINLLLSTYNDWFKIFPFDLPYFKHLKEKFKNIIPIHTGRKKYNKYSNTTKYETHNKNSLTVALLQITKNILTSINGAVLFEKGLLSDGEKIAIDLILTNRKMEIYELSQMQNTTKVEYIKILKKWFRTEKKFISEITPLLNKQIYTPKESIEKTANEIFINNLHKYKFETLEKVISVNKNELLSNIFSNSLPYKIAYLEFLGFIDYLFKQYCNNNIELHKLLAEILSTNERAIRGNINAMKNTKSYDRKRYTAYQHIEKVKEHYLALK